MTVDEGVEGCFGLISFKVVHKPTRKKWKRGGTEVQKGVRLFKRGRVSELAPVLKEKKSSNPLTLRSKEKEVQGRMSQRLCRVH